ncbi:hypothetical protein POF50_005795 [Streptomyces sp. SL13]|uniref:LPXTG cell wall anchor domain-containing protein n=1 Tax=Streptantibioticus silvisoli TaxID=2705255 RepID=A0AA90H1G1_9ACTN|nr:hypothetical protein [Streptantibioticus silvisoli]MDI5968860.1 hypothetical protein [Streptantibioticus silvisoli]
MRAADVHPRSRATAPRRIRLARLTVTVALSCCTLLGTAPLAAAAGSDDLPSRQAAVDVLNSADTRAEVCSFFDEPDPADSPGQVATLPDESDPCAGVPDFTIGSPVALNEIAEDFVSGAVSPDPSTAVTLGYAIAAVKFSDGRAATVMLSPRDTTGWEFAAVREGDTDFTYARQGDAAATVFNEPEIEAYYKLTGSDVEPLNDEARDGLDGRASVSLSEYQEIVEGRYANEESGSQYDREGRAGGFGRAAAKPSSQLSTVIVGGAGTSAAVAGVAVFLLRRKRITAR